MERVVRHQVVLFLEANNLIENNQHGLRSGRGTLTQLLDQHDYLVDILAQGQNVDCIYLDLSKAFDVVDHAILLEKLKSKGIHGPILKWFHEFLSDRDQFVRVQNTL